MKIAITAAFLLKATLVIAVVPETRAELQAEDVNIKGTVALMERKLKPKTHGKGKATCGVYAMADYHKFNDLLGDMIGDLKDKEFKIDGGQCDRVHCYDTTAFYVCNVGFLTITCFKGFPMEGDRKGNREKG